MTRKIVFAVFSMALLIMLVAVPVMAKPKESSPAWHTYPATDTYYEVTYEELTTMCLDAAGLSENPYPAPTTPTVDVDSALHVIGESLYYPFIITIGDKVYSGISCCVADLTIDISSGEGIWVVQTTHYFGNLGKMNHGFAGVVSLNLHGQLNPDFSYAMTYFTASWDMQGFGRFTGQTLMLWQDSRTSAIGTGDCIMLGNKWY